MRIIHLANHCRLGHGNAHVAVDLACVQASSGEQVIYMSEGGDFEPVLAAAGVQHIFLRQKTGNPLVALVSLARLARWIARFRADIVHAHMMSGAILAYPVTRLGRARLVTTVHNSFDSHSRIMKIGDLVVAVSEAERQHLASRKFPLRKLVTILNGPLYGARTKGFLDEFLPPLPGTSITTVCGLHPRKGVLDLINAFKIVAARYPDAYLNIVGDGPDRLVNETYANGSGFGDRIRFHGELKNPYSILAASDIFVLASHYDPFPLVNMEARLAGCAMIGTAVGGIPEALEHGKAGLLVPPRDPSALAAALTSLFAEPLALAAGKAASRRGVERFGVDRMYADYQRAYKAVLLSRRHPVSAIKAGESVPQAERLSGPVHPTPASGSFSGWTS